MLELARRDAVKICVGKSPGGAGTSQQWINDRLVEHARAGRRVVRLKGGDPFVFGRGGEELEALAHAGIAYSVIPGITAASACAAYAGIPLTHRDHAQSVCLVTGHAGEDGREPDWRALAADRTTAVFYMGLTRLEHIVAKLIRAWRAARSPGRAHRPGHVARAASRAGHPGEHRRLGAIARYRSPALLVVGEVAALHAELAWFGGTRRRPFPRPPSPTSLRRLAFAGAPRRSPRANPRSAIHALLNSRD